MQTHFEKPRWRIVLACVVLANAAATRSGIAAGHEAALPVKVINYSALPVHATATRYIRLRSTWTS